MCQQLVVGKQVGSRTPVYQKILMIVNKQNSNRKICEAFYELPGSKSRLFMGCQASELNHLTKPFKMGLQLTNHRFNCDKFRVCKRLTCQTFDGSCQDYLDRSGLLDEGRLTRGFRWIHQASKPWLDSQLRGSFQTLCCFAKKSPQVTLWAMLSVCLCLSLYGVQYSLWLHKFFLVWLKCLSRGVAVVQTWPSPLVIFFIFMQLLNPV